MSDDDELYEITSVVARLGKLCQHMGGQSNWAKANGVSTAYVNDILQGRREPGKKVLDVLGFEKRVYYAPLRSALLKAKGGEG